MGPGDMRPARGSAMMTPLAPMVFMALMYLRRNWVHFSSTVWTISGSS